MERHINANLNIAERGRIIGLHQGGHNKAEIARIVGCSRRTVALWITKHEEGGINNLQDHRKNNRRPQKTTPEENEEIVRAMDENPFGAAETVLQNRNLNISVRTIRRRLNAAKVHSRPAVKKIKLKPEHQRMQFAREHLNTPQEEWNAVVWMNEKVFSSAEDGRYRIWRPEGKRLNPKYVLPSGYSERITLGFWRNMTANGLLDLVEISPRMDAEEYVEILQEVLKAGIRRLSRRTVFGCKNSKTIVSFILLDWCKRGSK